MKRISLFFSIPQWEALVALSKELGISFSETVRRAIDRFLEEHRKL